METEHLLENLSAQNKEADPEKQQCTNPNACITLQKSLPNCEEEQEKNIVANTIDHLDLPSNDTNCEVVMKQSEERGPQNVNNEENIIIENDTSENNNSHSVEPEEQCVLKLDESEENNKLIEKPEVVDELALINNNKSLEIETVHTSHETLEENAMEVEEAEREEMVFSGTNTSERNDVHSCTDDGINKYSKNCLEIASITKPFEKSILRGCKWSPDGSCLLTNSDDNQLRLFDLPIPLYTKQVWKTSEDKSFDLPISLKVNEGGPVYDFAWYPLMSSSNPLTCCFISTSAASPVHLWNAYTGGLEASYRCYDYADELASAMSVAFSLSGGEIFCGLRNQVKIFKIEIPGKDCTTINLKAIARQCGLVSCIAFNPVLPQVFALGTYRKSVGIYTVDGSNICVLHGHRGGVTHLTFSKDGSKLFTGARKDRDILCWDLRKPGHILCSMPRFVFTNQRVYFDLTPEGNYLLSGNTNGNVSFWDLESLPKDSGDEIEVEPTMAFQAHMDCTNSCSVNPQFPVLATGSGKWYFPELASDEKGDDFFDFESKRRLVGNSVKLWWMGKQET